MRFSKINQHNYLDLLLIANELAINNLLANDALIAHETLTKHLLSTMQSQKLFRIGFMIRKATFLLNVSFAQE